jgi:transposase
MARFVGLDVSQKLTSICVVDDAGSRLWRGQCHSEPEPIERAVRRHAGDDASIGIETGPMTPWLVHELRGRGLNVVCLDARHASAALKMHLGLDARTGQIVASSLTPHDTDDASQISPFARSGHRFCGLGHRRWRL